MAPLLRNLLLTAPLLSLAQAGGGSYIINCGTLSVQRSDPIVNPGQVGGHVHAVVGGTAFNRTETNAQARAAKDTTCFSMDKSNYWVPQLYHENKNGTYTLMPFHHSLIYYQARSCDYNATQKYCPKDAPVPRAPPAGFRVLAGDPKRRTYDKTDFRNKAIGHVCYNNETKNGVPQYNSPQLPNTTCDYVRPSVYFPSCWDGVNLESNSTYQHVAYPNATGGDYNGGPCPSTHPVAIFSIFYEFFFVGNRAVQQADFNRYVYAMGDATGYGFHGDFLNGWTDQDALQRSFETCTGPDPNGGKDLSVDSPGCSLRVNGSLGKPGQKLKPEVPEPDEDVGVNGPLAKLPGNNPVTGFQ